MAITSKDLLAQMQAQYQNGGYKKKTDEELRQQAQQEYGAYYDQQRLNAQQQFERNDLALQQQKAALDYAFQKQQEAAEKEYNEVYSQADRQLLSRGMQRSSYGAQTLANIRQQQADVYMDLESQLAAKGNDIEAQRVQLGDQYSATLNQYDAAQAADELNRLRELEEQEYERGVQADERQNDMALQLYEMMKAEEAAAQSGSSGGGSGGGGSGGGGGEEVQEEAPLPSANGFDGLINSLNGVNKNPVGSSGLGGAAVNGGSLGVLGAIGSKPSLPDRLVNSQSNVQPNTTTTIQGPVSQKFISDLNAMGEADGSGKSFEGQLLNDLKNGKLYKKK